MKGGIVKGNSSAILKGLNNHKSNVGQERYTEVRKMRCLLAISALLVCALVIVSGAWAAVIYSDDFSTDPASRWSQSITWGTAGFTQDTVNQTLQLWASGMGGAQMKSTGTAPTITKGYTASIDFRSDVGIAGNTAILWANRQPDDSHYTIQSYPGGSGEVMFTCSGGGLSDQSTWTAQNLSSGVWYTLQASVYYTAGATNIRIAIKDRATGAYAISPWTVVDSSSQRLVGNTGYGFAASSEQTAYSTFMTLDNYALIEEPDIENDDFCTDPFAARWSGSTTSGTAWFSYDSTEQAVKFWASGMGNALMKSEGTSATITGAYTASVDFRNDVGIGSNLVGLWVNRQAGDAHYMPMAYFGGNGAILFMCGGQQSNWTSQMLTTGVWYTLQASVYYTADSTRIQISVKDRATGNDAVNPWTFVDSTAGRLTGNTGYGIETGTGQPEYKDFMTLDNFRIIQDPPLENDDFSTDPTVSRWIQNTTWNTAWFSFNSAEQAIKLWASSMGGAQMKSAGTSPTVTDPYVASIDFRSDYGITANAAILWLNRQANDAHYTLTAYPGGNGAVLFMVSGGGFNGQSTWTSEMLSPGVWYTLQAKVVYGSGTTQIRAAIKNKSTGLDAVSPGQSLTRHLRGLPATSVMASAQAQTRRRI